MLAETSFSNLNQNGFKYPPTYGYYNFILTAFNAGTSTVKQYGSDYFIMEPQPDQNLILFEALNRQAGHLTVLRFKWKLSIAAVAGDEIWLEFQTNNGSYSDSGVYKD